MTKTQHTTPSPNNKKQSFTPTAPIMAILWDVDGTLVLTEDKHHQSLVMACADCDVTIHDDEFQFIQGLTQDQCYKYLSSKYDFNTVDVTAWKHKVDVYYHELAQEPEFTFPSLIPLLRDIAASPIHQAAVSNGQKKDVALSIKQTGEEFFEFYYSIDDTKDGKPAPTPYLMAAERLGVAPENCLVIEDSAPGVQSGISAGMQVITRPYAYYEENKHVYDQANLVVDDLENVDWYKILGL